MKQNHCDTSPMKKSLKQHLHHLDDVVQLSLNTIDNEEHCLLSDFNEIRDIIKKVESIAASFYLQCYLSSFSTKYMDLSLAIQHLSERRHGGLIIIQRNDPLDSYIHSGISLGASLSHSLLESIFYPGSPLHDGAVLIISDQIVSASNVLPVSNTIVTDTKIGTRHRAALGLSEQTDALVLIVSEETGNASFAYKGTLQPINFIEPTTLNP